MNYKTRFQGRTICAMVGLALVLVTLAAYFGVWRNDFVELDDQHYVFANPHVIAGVKWSTVVWAFTEVHTQNWHPITWLSHAVDVELFGLKAGGHHFTNLVFHLANVILLFFVLRRMTGSTWRSALVAALFGVHPLHVESVAWVAERKDVLSAFFFLLTLIFYGSYTKAKDTSQSGRSITLWYSATLFAFALGLMSKPMLVTVPFVLLLLDWWPLERFERQGGVFKDSLLRLAREKIPFLILSGVSSIITLNAQSGAMSTIQQMPLNYRLSNALRSYWVYIKQTFWPENLTIFYPHEPISSGELQMGGVILALITIAALLYARRARFLATGWFWYLGMLVPVIGLVQVGSQAHADRYTYLPHIGFFVALVWSLGALVLRFGWLRFGIAPVMAGVVAVLAIESHKQVRIWRDSLSLFGHGAKVNPRDYLARSILAQHEMRSGRIEKAIRQLETILNEAPAYPLAELLLSEALQKEGRMEEAIPHLLKINAADYLTSRNARLILSYLHTGSLSEAEMAMAQLMQLNPRDPAVWFMQAAMLRHAGEAEKAKELFRISIQNGSPPRADNPTLNFEIAELYVLVSEPKAAVPFYSASLETGSTNTTTLNNFAWLLATCKDPQVRDGAKAVQLAKKACELTRWEVPVMIGTLAAAYAEAGKFDEAVKTAEKARDLARAQGAEDLAKRNEELLDLYRKGQAYREE